MDWTIQIQNRIKTGFLVGFSYYGADDACGYSEVQLHLGLICINFIWL